MILTKNLKCNNEDYTQTIQVGVPNINYSFFLNCINKINSNVSNKRKTGTNKTLRNV